MFSTSIPRRHAEAIKHVFIMHVYDYAFDGALDAHTLAGPFAACSGVPSPLESLTRRDAVSIVHEQCRTSLFRSRLAPFEADRSMAREECVASPSEHPSGGAGPAVDLELLLHAPATP